MDMFGHMARKKGVYVIMEWLVVIVTIFSFFIFCTASDQDRLRNQHISSSPPVKLRVSPKYVEIDNQIVKLVLTNPTGLIAAIQYKGIDNVLEHRRYRETHRGYWDIVWTRLDKGGSTFDMLNSESFRVVAETNDQVEVSFTMTWNVSRADDVVPLNIDKRFVVLCGLSGFYSYAIFEHLQGWPDLNIDEGRIAFKLHQDLFHYMAISDDKQRIMPTDHDRRAGETLMYKEAVLLTNPRNPTLKGEVDDKYQYSIESKDNRLHGWISSKERVGFWVITPSSELRAGGPLKPELTSHAGPTSLAMFFSSHYAGREFGVRLRDGEHWKKVFGPVFMYLNSDSNSNVSSLWEDAKRQMSEETQKWPYDFPLSIDFQRSNQRGTITGRLLVHDRFISWKQMPAKSAYIGLAPPGNVGSWQSEAKGYQFWTQTNEEGEFTIGDIHADTYNLYAWVPGIIGDYKYDTAIVITEGSNVQIGDLVYEPPRNGPTLWEIGIPDRSAAEFFIPDPTPDLVNKLYINKEKYRQYGLWDRYTQLYPKRDLSYVVGVSDYRKDWFFAHVNRKIGKDMYAPTTWHVSFDLRNVSGSKTYTLQIALASANFANIHVMINNPNARQPDFETRRIGKDNAIARHGIHGQYWLYSITIHGFQLVEGTNIIYLKQAKSTGPFNGVMYDYIRLEGPSEG